MLTATREFKVYSFDELSEEAKENALEEYRYVNVDYPWYESELDWVAEDWLNKYGIGFKPNSVSFDIDRSWYLYFHGQGNIWVENAGKLAMAVYGKGYNLLTNNNLLEFSFHNHYYGGGSGKTSLAVEDFRNAESKDLPADCEQWFHELCQDLLRMLKNQWEASVEDDAVIDTIKANDFKFFESGSPSLHLSANTLVN